MRIAWSTPGCRAWKREAWYSLIGRAALWTAKRLAPESPLASALPAKELTRGDLPLSLSTPGDLRGEINVRIWDADGRKRHEGSAAAVPLLPCGRYFVCVRRTCESKTADWAFGWFDVKDRRSESNRFVLDSDSKKPGEPVRATV